MPLQIPRAAEKPLEEFIRLPPDKAKAFVAALNGVSPSLYVSDLAESVAEKSDIPHEQAEELLGAIAGMYLARASTQKGMREFINDVRQALAEKKENAELQPKDWESFESNLTAVLSAENTLGVTAKAIDVMTEHEHVFQKVRIVTDARPIFGEDARKQPAAAVIVHMLNVFYRDLGEMKQLCFALDTSDLKQLKQVIERAEVKEATLKSLLKSNSLICLESK